MASINISEKDFEEVASAANAALERGDREAALALDKIARKINAALSRDIGAARIARHASGHSSPFSWKDVPSTLSTPLSSLALVGEE